MKKLFVASKNLAKVEATKNVFNDFEVVSVNLELNYSKQPKNVNETINGARLRAKSLPNGYRLGLEAGVDIIDNKCFLVNYGVLIDKDNNEYIAGGTQVPLPDIIKDEIYINNLELKDAMNKHFGKVEELGGTIEIITNGKVTRVDIFTHICCLLKGELERKIKNA